jgi:tetratricopeptide (TPR) repeat protein
LRPDYGTAWLVLGQQLLHLGEAGEALAALTRAHELLGTGFWTSRPATAELSYSLALANHGVGETDAVARWCREALVADAAYAHAAVLLVDVLITRGERREALLVLDRALAAAPGDARLQQKRDALRR